MKTIEAAKIQYGALQATMINKITGNTSYTKRDMKQAMEENEFKHIPISLAPSAKPCKPVGCEHCFYTGYLGRKALYEVLPMDGELSMAIRENRSSVDEIIAAKGLKTLKETAVDLFSRGETSLDEVLPFMN